MNFDAIQHFETIRFTSDKKGEYQIPEVKYCFYKYVVAIDHHKNQIHIVENLLEDEKSQMDYIHHLLSEPKFSTSKFKPVGEETSNITNEEYKYMVTKGKEHCYRGDVFRLF
ncbi:MAG: hypothetical protein R2764_23460 [Bacteroidales bacterium]